MRVFRVTVVELESGDTHCMDVTEGDYILIPFEPCRLNLTRRWANGTVQLTLRSHHPAGPARTVEREHYSAEQAVHDTSEHRAIEEQDRECWRFGCTLHLQDRKTDASTASGGGDQ